MDPLVAILAFLITVGGAVVQGTVGLGFAMVTIPILALIDPVLVPVPQLFAAVPLTLLMAWKERSDMDLHGVGWLLAGRVPGAIIGVVLLAIATDRTLEIFIGTVVLLAVAVIATGFHVKRNAATKFAAGVASGTTGLVASIGGPPIALIYTSDEAATIRSTLAAIFTIGLTITITMRFATGNVTTEDLRISALLAPATVVGWALAQPLQERIPRHMVRTSILVISALGATALLARAILG